MSHQFDKFSLFLPSTCIKFLALRQFHTILFRTHASAGPSRGYVLCRMMFYDTRVMFFVTASFPFGRPSPSQFTIFDISSSLSVLPLHMASALSHILFTFCHVSTTFQHLPNISSIYPEPHNLYCLSFPLKFLFWSKSRYSASSSMPSPSPSLFTCHSRQSNRSTPSSPTTSVSAVFL